jgi:hypothetical protein
MDLPSTLIVSPSVIAVTFPEKQAAVPLHCSGFISESGTDRAAIESRISPAKAIMRVKIVFFK